MLRSIISALLKAAAAASFLCLSLLSPVLIPPLYAGAALDSLNEITAPAESPVVPWPPEPPAAGPAASVSAARALNVYFISVGQGDSEYIELPNGKNALIDGGPSKSTGSLLAQFLARHNVTKIDYVVLSHPHTDHYTGLNYVFSNFTVGNFYDTRMDNLGSAADNALRDRIRGLGVNVSYPAPGDALDWDPDVQAKVFNSCPVSTQSFSGQAVNNCSIVIKAAYQRSSVLFAGDIENEVESALVSKYGGELQADALKVAHHGSSTSSGEAFLAAVKPCDAYISAGAGNNYNLPAAAVLARLWAAGATVHQTDMDGTQEFSIGASPSPAGQALAFMR
ncbi:MAG: MBL fold metallo-hydrolase [Elusimicrobia bacterium]|nr:MBL fold metallo-hydrolase [Elusimicrobiota bacterium]